MEWKARVRCLPAFFPPHNCPLDGLMEIGSAQCLQSFKRRLSRASNKGSFCRNMYSNFCAYLTNNSLLNYCETQIRNKPLSISMVFQAMNGFLLLATQTGKLLYISDNAAEYLGHSMVSDLIIDFSILKTVLKHRLW